MMTTREEKLGKIKEQIAKAVGEIEHGDHAAAEYALANGLIAVVSYLEAKWSELAVETESQQERFVASMAEQKPEAPTKIKRLEKR